MRPDDRHMLSKIDCCYLDNYFKQVSNEPQCLNLTRVHGFLTAIITTPTLVKPVDWTPVILGNESNFHSLDHAEKVMDLILELYRQISCQLRGIEPYQLLLWDGAERKMEETCSETLLQEWCIGYLSAIKLDPLWETDKNAVSMLEPFSLFSTRPSFNQNNSDNKDQHPYGCMMQYRRHLRDFVEDNYAYWLNEREEEIRLNNLNQQNNPTCPCGSKLTFSECCCTTLSTVH